jgi:hypothetical protein
MSEDNEFDDAEIEEDIPEDDLADDDLGDDALEADDTGDVLDLELESDDLVAEVEVDVDAVIDKVDAPAKPAAARTGDEDDEDVIDLDEELHPDDVEAPLDALLQERTAKATLEDDEEELEDEEVDADAPGDGPTKIVPRRPGEFLCSSCFLVLPRNQLADERRMLCRDCV